eukprot:m.96473 g.96473  ORF g.96473 m.96473 type:complete len:1966 (-) comp15051_c0_seq13:183-6080(-)
MSHSSGSATEQKPVTAILPNLQLTTLPPVFSASSLVHIDLSFNRITTLTLPSLPNLQHLNVAQNQLHQLPSNLKAITPKLTVLLASFNNLRAPLQDLPALVQLDLSHNANLSSDHLKPLARLTSLRIVNLSGLHNLDLSPFTSGQSEAMQVVVLPHHLGTRYSRERREGDLLCTQEGLVPLHCLPAICRPAEAQAIKSSSSTPSGVTAAVSAQAAVPTQAAATAPSQSKKKKKKRGAYNGHQVTSSLLGDIVDDPDFAAGRPTPSQQKVKAKPATKTTQSQITTSTKAQGTTRPTEQRCISTPARANKASPSLTASASLAAPPPLVNDLGELAETPWTPTSESVADALPAPALDVLDTSKTPLPEDQLPFLCTQSVQLRLTPWQREQADNKDSIGLYQAVSGGLTHGNGSVWDETKARHYKVVNQPLWKNVCHSFECRYELLEGGNSVRVLGPSKAQVRRIEEEGAILTGCLSADNGQVVLMPDQGLTAYPRVVVKDVSLTNELATVVYTGKRKFKSGQGRLAALSEYILPSGCRVEVSVIKMQEEEITAVLTAVITPCRLTATQDDDAVSHFMAYDSFTTIDQPGTFLFDDAIAVLESDSSDITVKVAVPDVSAATCRWDAEDLLSHEDRDFHSLSQGRHKALVFTLDYDMMAQPTLVGNCETIQVDIKCNATYTSIAKGSRYDESAAKKLEKLVILRNEEDPAFMRRAVLDVSFQGRDKDIVAYQSTCMQAAVAMIMADVNRLVTKKLKSEHSKSYESLPLRVHNIKLAEIEALTNAIVAQKATKPTQVMDPRPAASSRKAATDAIGASQDAAKSKPQKKKGKQKKNKRKEIKEEKKQVREAKKEQQKLLDAKLVADTVASKFAEQCRANSAVLAYLHQQTLPPMLSRADVVKNTHHDGLGLEAYATFTSPLRRPEDLIAQRLLLAAYHGVDAKDLTKKNIDVQLRYVNRNSTGMDSPAQLLSLQELALNKAKGMVKATYLGMSSSDMDLVLYIPDLALVVACPLPPLSLMPHWKPTQSQPPNPNGVILLCPKLNIHHGPTEWPNSEFARRFTDSKGSGSRLYTADLLREFRPGDNVGVMLSLENSLTKLGPIQAVQLFDQFLWPVHLSQHPTDCAGLGLLDACKLGVDYENPCSALLQLCNLKDALRFEELAAMLTGNDNKDYLTFDHSRRLTVVNQDQLAVRLSTGTSKDESFFALVVLHGESIEGGQTTTVPQWVGYGTVHPIVAAMDAILGRVDDKQKRTRDVKIALTSKIHPRQAFTAVTVTRFAMSNVYHQFDLLLSNAPASGTSLDGCPIWLQAACGAPGLKALKPLSQPHSLLKTIAISTFKTKAEVFSPLQSLNKKQYNAVKAALTTSRLTFVKGPPGTGKSRLLAILTEALLTDLMEKQPAPSQDEDIEDIAESYDKILETASSNDATDNMMLAYVGLDKDYGDFPVLRVLPPSYERKLLPVLQLMDLDRMVSRQSDEEGDEDNGQALNASCDVSGLLWRAHEIVNMMISFDNGENQAVLRQDEQRMIEKQRLEWLQMYCSPAVIHKYDVRLREDGNQANHATLTKYLLHSKLWDEHFENVHKEFLAEYLRLADNQEVADNQEALVDWLIKQASSIKNQYTRQRKRLLERARVVYMTNDTAIAMLSTKSESFTVAHMLFDEAAFSLAPTTLVLMDLTEGRCVFVGDEEQLPIVVKHRSASAANLHRSLFECLSAVLDKANGKGVFPAASLHSLKNQYRMDIKIGKYISKQFYDGTLQAVSTQPGDAFVIAPVNPTGAIRGRSFLREHEPLKKLLPGHSFAGYMIQQSPFYVQNLWDYDWTADFKSQSSLNVGEARTIIKLVIEMAKELWKEKWSCRIITPYHNQRVLLARMLDLAKEQGWLHGVKDITVDIIESMQGGECDVTILSLVKAAKGREAMKNRLNVALSRAKHRSIVVMSRAEYKDVDLYSDLLNETKGYCDGQSLLTNEKQAISF